MTFFLRARLSRRGAEGVALEDWPGEDPDRAVRRHPGHLQADPLRDKHPPAQLLPRRQGGGHQGLQSNLDRDKGIVLLRSDIVIVYSVF